MNDINKGNSVKTKQEGEQKQMLKMIRLIAVIIP